MSAVFLFLPFGASLLTLSVAERVTFALVSFFYRGPPGHSSKDPFREQLLVGGALNLLVSAGNGCVLVVVRSASLVGWLLLWYLLFYCLSAAWFVLYEQYPSVVDYVFRFYSSRIGPFLHGYLLVPLDLLNLILRGVLPLYNGVVWMLRSLLSKGLLPIFWEQGGLLLDLSAFAASALSSLVGSLVNYLWALDCTDLSCLESPPALDLVSPLGSVRGMAATGARLGAAVCSPLAGLLEFALYPLMDVNVARGLHGLVNGALQVLVHVPQAALKRCQAHGRSGTPFDLLLCTPDLQPAADFLVVGLRELGKGMDSWLGVGAALAQRAAGGAQAAVCPSRTLDPSAFRRGLLSGPQTSVGLTDWLMASANGTLAYFFGHVTADVAPRVWPEPVDVSFGLAAVSFDEAAEVEVSGVTQGQRPSARQTTSLLGCRCVDSAAGLVVRCSVLPLTGPYSAATHSFDAAFQDRTWTSQLTCASAELSVRSVRWPVRRYEGKSVPFQSDSFLDVPELDCVSRGTCESVDATIWLVPRCDLLRPEQCSDVALGTSCYPFCLAARVAGSRAARPVFADAGTWRAGTQLLGRDCALAADGSEASQTFRLSADVSSALAYGETSLSSAGSSENLYVSSRSSSRRCTGASNVASWVPANATAADPRSVPSYVRRRGQPFAVAGDAALLHFDTAGGAATVEVDRLSGNQRDVYSLKPGWAGLPAAPKSHVPIFELTQEERGKVVVPLDWVSGRVPTTSSRNFVFYAVSPDLQIFKAYLDYCSGATALPQVQVMMFSSYSALRVYRVRAFCQSNCESGDLAAQFTFDGFSDGKFSAQNFPQDCSRVYNASIDGLEYVNEQNLAVTVQVADKTYDAALRAGSNSTYVTYWLNPQTMAARLGDMWPTEQAQSPSVGTCVVASGVPHVGSLGAELAVAGLHVLHRILGAFLYAPGLVSMWRARAPCPLVARGHSVMESCGRTVFDLDDFFDSLDSSSGIFWGIPVWIAEQLEQGKTVQYSPASDLLRGLGAYGRGAVGIAGLQNGGVISLLNTPVAEQFSSAYALVRNPGVVSGAAKVVGGASSWARFSARFFAVVGADVAQRVVSNGGLGLGDLWQSMVGTMYDQRPFFKSAVTDRAVSACLGLQVMFGGANPAGLLFYHSCTSSALLLDGAFDSFLHLFVDAPVVKCVCKDSEGRVVGRYVRDYCLDKAPQSMRPLLLGMVAASEGVQYGDSLLCPNVIAYARSAMEKSMRPYFSSVHSSLDALGNLVDYMMVGFDSDAGRCEDFWQNPQVVVIMPEPVDYFQGCGATTSCKAKCSGTWGAFQSAVAPYDPSRLTSSKNMTRQVDSMFFPTVVADMIAPGTVVAITRPHACGTWVCRDGRDDCLAVASVVLETVQVTYYCVPANPSAVVYASDVPDLSWESAGGGWNASSVQFVDHAGSSLAALMGKYILFLQRGADPKTVMHVDAVLSLPYASMYPLHLMDFMVVRGRLLVNVAVRVNSGGNFERSVATLWVHPASVQDVFGNDNDRFPAIIDPPLRSIRRGYAVAEYPYPDNEEGVDSFLLWPLTTEGGLRRLTLRWTNTTVEVLSLEPFQAADTLLARATLVPRSLVLSKTLREDRALGQLVMFANSGDTYDWLRQLRLSGSGLSLTSASWANSQPVPAEVSVVTACDGLDCRGCPDLLLRSLCSAYQRCAVFRCIGTPVNLKRPLCGVGGTIKSLGAVGVENVQGAWIMFVDIYMILLQLKVVNNLPGVDVSFPDDAFLGNMCAAKDVSAELISILTATVNSASQRVQAVGRVLGVAAPLDSSVNTAMSMSTAAVTGFLNQIALLPVYVLSVGHKIMMCQVSGTLAVIGRTGFSINIQPAKFSATDAVSGQCLTRGAEVGALQTGDAQAFAGTSLQVSHMLSYMGTGSALKRLEPYMHMADGSLTYLIGVAAKLGDVLQALDIRRCVLPDVTLPSTVKCACGDKPLRIAAERRREGLEGLAMWCTGTLSLVDGSNRLQVVWNPYTYEQLQAIVGGRLDAYLEAASKDSMAVPFNDPVFAAQGVSVFAVLTRCRQNYVNKQWDPAAYARFDSGVMLRELKGGVEFLPGDPAASGGVGRCLLDSVQNGVDNGACLDSYLMNRGLNDAYWAYTAAGESLSGELVDACLVFSGPASNASVSMERRRVFQECLGGYGEPDRACDLSGFVWSPASANAVPVAERHVVSVGAGNSLQDAYDQRMQRASDLVRSKLEALGDYENKDLVAAVFSAEGDVIHQLMDCVFLGPYARMDYWPVPRCDESAQDDCLVGPYWSRDAGRGRSRSLDLDACQPSGELPFTCGSPTRRAMVKDFVEQYLMFGEGGADGVRDLVRGWLANQTLLWYNPGKFGCNSSGGCAPGSYLPRDLAAVSLELGSKQLVSQLRDRMRQFYGNAMNYTEPWLSFLAGDERAKYVWNATAGAHRVEPLAAFHPAMPTVGYVPAEAASPGAYSLWHTCHSALRQVMFTIPVTEDGSVRGVFPEFRGGALDNIVEAVRKITAGAKESSPLYRHYQPRHHPSQSRVCRSAEEQRAVPRGSASFSNFAVNGMLLLNGSDVPKIPVLGFDAGELGKNVTSTFLGLSDHLGFMDPAATEAWLRGEVQLQTSAEFLLRYGAGGLKVGNLPRMSEPDLGLGARFSAGLDAVISEFFNESSRAHSREDARLDGCDAHARAQNFTADLLREFVDGLFPMAQGVGESGVGSYCLRFAVELSALQLFESHPGLDVRVVVAQKELVQRWRTKCGTQVQLVGMCGALDLYHDGGAQPWSCLHPWRLLRNVTFPGEDMYVTPDCLVKIGDFFYDPCLCNPQWCEPSEVTWWLKRSDLESGACALRFDPRTVVQSAELAWWAEDDPSDQARAWNAWRADALNLLDLERFEDALLLRGSAAGNMQAGSQHWATAEGYLADSGLFCDMVADYWPDEAAYPVGYHVTTPCHQSDAAYRTFDNVFVLDTDSSGLPVMRYMEDQSRDAELVDSNFGAGGLCRTTNFGFDMFETNTMRVCVRVSDAEDNSDVHVPRGGNFTPAMGLPRCSSSSKDLPWGDYTHYDYYDPAFYSVGTLPNLPDVDAPYYPSVVDRLLVVGPQHDMAVSGWGDKCQDFSIPNCYQSGYECATGYRCMAPGVCMELSVGCLRHADCSDGKMCTGMGVCEVPKLSVENLQDSDVSFRAHTTSCSGQSFTMRGGSPWGYVPDLLEAHGMCSYRHWREYLYTVEQCGCSESPSAQVCTINAGTCPYYIFSKTDANPNKWWNSSDQAPTRLKMLPTTCDRDYERMKLNNLEMKSCVPNAGAAWQLNSDGSFQQNMRRDIFWRVYDDDKQTVPLLRMPYMSSKSQGFLGGNSFDKIISCNKLQQCYVDEFTKNGLPAMKLVGAIRAANRTLEGGQQYNPNDQFRCGVIGSYDAVKNKCILDQTLFPIYYFMCGKGTTKPVFSKCQSCVKSGALSSLCGSVREEYEPRYQIINDVNVPALQAMFQIFAIPETFDQHLKLVDCATSMYDALSSSPFESRGLYFPFTFTVYEFPFAWFYQCMIGSSTVIANSFDKVLYNCRFFENKNINTLKLYDPNNNKLYTDFKTFIFNVRGGYKISDVQAQISSQLQLSLNAWSAAVDTVRKSLFGKNTKTKDDTRPYCYTEQFWNLPNDNPIKRQLIEAITINTCSDNLVNKLVAKLNNFYKLNKMNLTVNSVTVIAELTRLEKMVIQPGVTKSLLSGHIKDLGTQVLVSYADVTKLSLLQTPVQFNYSLPPVNSSVYIAARLSWRTSGMMPYQADVISATKPTCAPADYVNVYTDAKGVLLTAEDTNYISGVQEPVQTCKRYLLGYFGCKYYSYPRVQAVGFNGSDPLAVSKFNAYVDALYSAVKSEYERRMAIYSKQGLVGPVKMSPLTFYDNEPAGFANFQFDLTKTSQYMSNINPDVRTPVMCVAGNQQFDFNNCTDQNYLALRDHVQKRYMRDGGVVVPMQSQMDWSVSFSMLSAGALFSFAHTTRDINKQYMNQLLDTNSVCGPRAANSYDRLCYSQTTGSLSEISVINPWVSGSWNPYDKCDVSDTDAQTGNTELIDSVCYYPPSCQEGSAYFTNSYHADMPNKDECSNRNNQKTRNLNVNPSLLYNLCKHPLREDSICEHIQGMLGGTDGYPSEDNEDGRNLYLLKEFQVFPQGYSEMFGNVLLAGGRADYGFLRADSAHIGGHHLGMRIRDNLMLVTKMPLQTVIDKSRIDSWLTDPVSAWVPLWKTGMLADHETYLRTARVVDPFLPVDVRGKTEFSWDCPLRRRAFYTGRVKNFPPHLPSSRRSKSIFGGLTGNLFAHPTQVRMEAGDRFGAYLSTNGFCFCPVVEEVWPGMCTVSTAFSSEHNCSLYNTMQSLRGAKWGWSHTFRPKNVRNEVKVCSTQLDWPFLSGRLRDGGTVLYDDALRAKWAGASDVEQQRCHVLDRMPDFSYVYASRREMRRAGFDTLQRGVCHTGRAQRKLLAYKRCVRVSRDNLTATLMCADNVKSVVERPASATPAESTLGARFHRRYCSRCTPPPRFETRGGFPMQAESSFGVAYRRSAERVLSQELRAVLCNGTAQCSQLLNATAWKAGEFMAALLKRPRSLFSSAALLGAPNISLEFSRSFAPAPDDSALWARKWVHCPTKKALKTGVGCNGSITKAVWRRDKVGACHATLLDALKGERDPFAQTNICNIDSRLSELCQAIREAQSLVASANCLKSGDPKCSLQDYVYNPSTWETTNQAFVHQTVTDYYKRVDGCLNETDCICGVDPGLAALKANNNYVKGECAAVPVMTFRDVLVQLRSLVLPICKMLSSLFDVLFNLVLTLSSSAKEAANSRALLAWASFKQESSTVMDKFSDMVFDMVFSVGTLGPWLKTKLTLACNVVNGGYLYFADFWCNFATLKMPYFLGAVKSMVNWVDVGFSTVNDVFSVILNNYLPNAMMELYQHGYKEYFQEDKYKEKTKAYEERKQPGAVNKKQKGILKSDIKKAESRADNKLMNALGEGRSKTFNRGAVVSSQLVSAVPGPVGIVAGVVNFGIEAYQTYDMINTALKIKNALDKFPTTWTLFDYDTFYDAIDAMADFLNSNWECFEVDKEVAPLQCIDLNLTSPGAKDVNLLSPRPTACWAEPPQGQLGVSSLYSCTATSTCCVDPLNCDVASGARLCSDCDSPPQGFRRYGCNTLTQRCQCGVQAIEVDRCSAQRDCGPTTSCSLLTSMDDVSFGSLGTCTQCPSSPVCLMGSSQQFGQCTCLTNAEIKVELCSASRGSLVNPDPARLCGVAKDSGSFFSWSELSLVRCVSAVRPVCADVVAEDGNVFRMPVCTSTKPVQVAYSSRRLLSVDDSLQLPSVFLPDDPADDVTPDVVHRVVFESEWNHTAAPCSSLAFAYRAGKALGPLEESALHSCVYWRTVARQLIRENSLTALERHDTFLLSAGDFSSCLGQRGVLLELLSKPLVMLHAVMYSDFFKPMRAALVASHDPNVTSLLHSWKHRIHKRIYGRAPRHNKQTTRGHRGSGNGTQKHGGFSNRTHGLHALSGNSMHGLHALSGNSTHGLHALSGNGRSRKLLQVSYEQVHAEAVALPYYSQMRGGLVDIELVNTSDTLWGSDAFTWRSWGSGTCPAAEAAVSNLKYVSWLLRAYYQHLPEELQEASSRKSSKLADNLPSFRVPNVSLSGFSTAVYSGRPAVLQWVLDASGVSMDDVAAFLREPCPKKECGEANRHTASSMVESVFFCQLDTVMFCPPHRRDLLSSAVLVFLFYVAVSWISSYLSLYGVSTALWLSLPLLIVWYSTGVSVRCFPMIPTCLLDDVIWTVKRVLPSSLFLPARLVKPSGAFESCASLNFTTWEDPLAFIICDLGFCANSQDISILGVSQWKFRQMHLASTGDHADAHRLCSTVTFTYAVPVIFAGFLALGLLTAAIISVLQLLPPSIDLVWKAIMVNRNVVAEKT